MVSQRASFRQRAEAEAAAWVARLQSDSRDEATESAFKAWLSADSAHREAFERATDVWGLVPGAALFDWGKSPVPPIQPNVSIGPGARLQARGLDLVLAAALLLMVGGGGLWWWLAGPTVYLTRVGEQRIATLKDGSRIALNTDTSVDIDFAEDVRRVTLEHGEAMFEVAPNKRRPFIVTAGNKTVRAVGTRFIVRRINGDVTVTLIEGKVAIGDVQPQRQGVSAPTTVLHPGERLLASSNAPASIDRPSIEAATAWRRGQAVFDDTPLSAAVAELNRYGGPRIAVGDPRLGSLRVSGVFATNDSAEFANAIAGLYSLHVQAVDGELRIVR